MNTTDLLLRWSQLSLDQIEDEIRNGKDADSVDQLLGPGTTLALQGLSFAPPAAGPREAVVLLPGIMGSLLSSIRGVTTLVWINPLVYLNGNARYLRLSEDGMQDTCPEVEMAPVGLEKITYLKLELILNRQVDLFEFPYDWRKPVTYNADLLHDSLERWAGGTQRKFTLLAHSMGGLVSRAYLARHPQDGEKRVKQLIMLGTPHYGATNSIATLFSGNPLMAQVDGLNHLNNMIDVVRGLPGVYNLLPAPQDCFPTGEKYPANWDLYDAPSWKIPGILQGPLDNTRALHSLLGSSDPQVPLVQIAGCNLQTLVSLECDFSLLNPASLTAQVLKQAIKLVQETTGAESGDGTVPLWSSRLPGAQLFYIEEKHTNLPNNPQVIQAALNLINGEPCDLPAALPEPRTSFLGISFDVTQETPEPPELLEARLRSGTATGEDLRKLHFAL